MLILDVDHDSDDDDDSDDENNGENNEKVPLLEAIIEIKV